MYFSQYAFAAILFPLLLPPVPQQPQQPAPIAGQKDSYTLTANPKLVVLDVVVTDKKGNLVTNLKKDDFEVQEDKQPQSIHSFEIPAQDTLPPNVVIHSTEELDRLAPNATATIIVLDENTNGYFDIYTARYNIQQYLKAQPQLLSQPTMLVAVNVNRMIVLHDYTQERDTLLTALNRHNWGNEMAIGKPWTGHDFAGSRGVQYLPGGLEVLAAYRTLEQVAQATAGHPGHKNVIWVGRGLVWGKTGTDETLKLQVELQKLIDQLIASRVTLSTIDLWGPGFNHAPMGNAPLEFADVAVATGGKPLYNRNDVDIQIATSIRDGNDFYSLSYIPTSSSDAKSAFRRIRIVMKDPKLRATTRTGYYPNPEREPGWQIAESKSGKPTSQEPKYKIDTTLLNTTLVYDGIPLTLERTDTPGRVVVHVDSDALPWIDHGPDHPRTAAVQISCISFDGKGRMLTHEGANTEVPSPATTPEGTHDASVGIAFKYDTDPRAVRLRVVVQATDSGKIGAANLDLTNLAAK